jgi:hypothetical protein
VGGTLASVGLAAGHTLNTTVMPFILRGVSLLGIGLGEYADGVTPQGLGALGSDLKPRHLNDMVDDRGATGSARRVRQDPQSADARATE